MTAALTDGVAYWNLHKHPYAWKKRQQEPPSIFLGRFFSTSKIHSVPIRLADHLRGKSEMDTYKSELLELIRDVGAYDKRQNWLYLNTLWHEPHARMRFSKIMSQYLIGVTQWTPQHVILVMESAVSTLGVVPIIGAIADNASCNLAVWRETLPISLSESWLLPSRLARGLKCVIVQDVISKGAALRRVAEDIRLVDWEVDAIVAVAKVEANSAHFDQNMKDFKLAAKCLPDFRVTHLVNFSDLLNIR